MAGQPGTQSSPVRPVVDVLAVYLSALIGLRPCCSCRVAVELPKCLLHLDELGELMSTNRFCSTLNGLRRKMSLPLLVTAAHCSGKTKE